MRRLRGDDGFSLIETSIGILIAAMAAVLFVGATSANNRLAATNRHEQQAIGLAIAQLESARSLSWSSLAMSAIEPGAPLLAPSAAALDAVAAGIPADETLVIGSGGSVDPLQVVSTDGATFSVWSFVTTSNYRGDVRRVVVAVEWEVAGSHRIVYSTLIAEASTS